MAVLFDLKNPRIVIMNPLVVDIMEHTLNCLCDMMQKNIIAYPVTPALLNRSTLIEDVVDYVSMFTTVDDVPVEYDLLSTIVGDIILELTIGSMEVEAKSLGHWFRIIPNCPDKYTVV